MQLAENLTDNGPGWVKISHPESNPEEGTVGTPDERPPYAEVTVEAWKEVWEKKGWQLAPNQDQRLVEANLTPAAPAPRTATTTATPPKGAEA